MNNTEEIVLRDLERFITRFQMLMYMATQKIKEQNLSQYPIFIATRNPIPGGNLLIDPKNLNAEWYLYVERLEFLYDNSIFNTNTLKFIQNEYANNDTYLNVIMLLSDMMRFLKVPIQPSLYN